MGTSTGPTGTVGRVALEVSDGGSVSLAQQPLFIGTLDDFWCLVDELLASGKPQLVVTPNVDQVITLGSDASFRAVYEAASVRLVDGAPLVLLARALGAHRIERITGADLLPAAVKRSSSKGNVIVITGGATSTLLAAASRLSAEFPGADVRAVPFPQVREVGDSRCASVVGELWAAEPDYVFLCLGSPKQEKWFAHWRESLPPAVYVGAGAAVDFAAGAKRRAPEWIQILGGEWLWRLASEPRRLAYRYLVRGPKFLCVVYWSVAAHLGLARR